MQDLLVLELRSVKVSIDGVHNEVRISIDSLRSEMNTSFGAVRSEIRLRDEKQSEPIRHLDEKQSATIKHVADNVQQLSMKIDSALDIRERLASLEGRLRAASFNLLRK